MPGEPFYLDGRSESYGLEFRINFQSKIFYGFANYALGKATSHFYLRNQPMRRLNDFSWHSFPSYGDIRHIFDAVIGLRSRSRWDFSVSVIFQTGRPYTAFFGSLYDYYTSPNKMNQPINFPFLFEGVFSIPDYMSAEHFYSDKNSYRLPFYQRVDVSATREFSWLKMKWTLFIQVYNLLFRRNTSFYLNSPNEKVDGLPILPTVGLKFQF